MKKSPALCEVLGFLMGSVHPAWKEARTKSKNPMYKYRLKKGLGRRGMIRPNSPAGQVKFASMFGSELGRGSVSKIMDPPSGSAATPPQSDADLASVKFSAGKGLETSTTSDQRANWLARYLGQGQQQTAPSVPRVPPNGVAGGSPLTMPIQVAASLLLEKVGVTSPGKLRTAVELAMEGTPPLASAAETAAAAPSSGGAAAAQSYLDKIKTPVVRTGPSKGSWLARLRGAPRAPTPVPTKFLPNPALAPTGAARMLERGAAPAALAMMAKDELGNWVHTDQNTGEIRLGVGDTLGRDEARAREIIRKEDPWYLQYARGLNRGVLDPWNTYRAGVHSLMALPGDIQAARESNAEAAEGERLFRSPESLKARTEAKQKRELLRKQREQQIPNYDISMPVGNGPGDLESVPGVPVVPTAAPGSSAAASEQTSPEAELIARLKKEEVYDPDKPLPQQLKDLRKNQKYVSMFRVGGYDATIPLGKQLQELKGMRSPISENEKALQDRGAQVRRNLASAEDMLRLRLANNGMLTDRAMYHYTMTPEEADYLRSRGHLVQEAATADVANYSNPQARIPVVAIAENPANDATVLGDLRYFRVRNPKNWRRVAPHAVGGPVEMVSRKGTETQKAPAPVQPPPASPVVSQTPMPVEESHEAISRLVGEPMPEEQTTSEAVRDPILEELRKDQTTPEEYRAVIEQLAARARGRTTSPGIPPAEALAQVPRVPARMPKADPRRQQVLDRLLGTAPSADVASIHQAGPNAVQPVLSSAAGSPEIKRLLDSLRERSSPRLPGAYSGVEDITRLIPDIAPPQMSSIHQAGPDVSAAAPIEVPPSLSAARGQDPKTRVMDYLRSRGLERRPGESNWGVLWRNRSRKGYGNPVVAAR